MVNPKNLEKHLSKVHGLSPSGSAKQTITAKKVPISNAKPRVNENVQSEYCPHCKIYLSPKGMKKHNRRRHGNLTVASKVQQTQKTTKMSDRQTVQTSSDDSLIEQRFEQSFNEPYDGSKYWGHMRRENGQFGSFPLFDDYDDESTS